MTPPVGAGRTMKIRMTAAGIAATGPVSHDRARLDRRSTVRRAAGFLAWYFFGPRASRPAKLQEAIQEAEIVVRGGYSPEVSRSGRASAAAGLRPARERRVHVPDDPSPTSASAGRCRLRQEPRGAGSPTGRAVPFLLRREHGARRLIVEPDDSRSPTPPQSPGAVPGARTGRTASLGGVLPNVERVDVLPYHRMALHKHERLGLPYPLAGVEPLVQVLLDPVRGQFQAYGCTPSDGALSDQRTKSPVRHARHSSPEPCASPRRAQRPRTPDLGL